MAPSIAFTSTRDIGQGDLIYRTTVNGTGTPTRLNKIPPLGSVEGSDFFAAWQPRATPGPPTTPSSTTLDTGDIGIEGEAMPLTATVSCPGYMPTGTVTFRRSGVANPIGTALLDGSGAATFDASGVLTTFGDYTLTAQFPGDTNCIASTGTPQTLEVLPAEAVDRYVDDVYEILLGRAADPSGLAYWHGLLVAGVNRSAIAWALVNSIEYRSNVIENGYEEFLGRPADAFGTSYFLAQTGRGMSFINIDAILVGSDEYYDDVGGTPDDFIVAMYEDILGREPDPAGVRYDEALLAFGVPRGPIAGGLFYSTEHLGGVIDALYEGILGRGIDPSGQAYWTGQVQAGMPIQVLIALLIGSDELWLQDTSPQAQTNPATALGDAHTPYLATPTTRP